MNVILSKIAKQGLLKELGYQMSRSGGKGGQHINKVESKVLLRWVAADSEILTEEQKNKALLVLRNRLTKHGVLLLECGTSRSQHKNKEIVTDRFFAILEEAIKSQKKRKATKISRAKIFQRLDRKKKHADKKNMRKRNFLDEF